MRRDSCSGESRGRRRHIHAHRAHTRRETVALDVLGRERRERRIDFDERHIEAFDAAREREPRGPDAGAKFDGAFAGARRHRGRQKDRVMAEAMAAPRLAQHEPAAEDSVLAALAESSGS